VEIVTGVMFVVTSIFVFNNSPARIAMQSVAGGQSLIPLIYYLFIVSCLIVIFFADLKYGIIPDKIIFPAIIVSGLYLALNFQLLIPHLLSAVGACFFFLLLFLITKGKGMGFGDVKFAFLMGLILGFPNIVVSLYVAFLTGAIVGCILIVWRKKRVFGTSIPFGPFLVLGTLVAIFYGEILFKTFLHLASL
jgi:prepilin signal peptidase PulO-like enzyme (type II secretory pathway)